MSLFNEIQKVFNPSKENVVATQATTEIIDLLTVKNFLRLEESDSTDDNFIETIIIPSAISVVLSRTGIPKEELANYKDLIPAILLLCSQFYDNRSGLTSSQVRENPIIASILNSRRRNLI